MRMPNKWWYARMPARILTLRQAQGARILSLSKDAGALPQRRTGVRPALLRPAHGVAGSSMGAASQSVTARGRFRRGSSRTVHGGSERRKAPP